MKTATLDKDLFKAGYSVYLIVLTNNNEHYYYIGQTGDRHHLSARPIYYRISGHLGYADSSSENQFVKGLQNKKPNLTNKHLLFEFINKSEINIHYVMLNEFVEGIERPAHREKVVEVEELEQFLINKFKSRPNYFLLNKKVIPKSAIPSSILIERIKPLLQIIEQY